MDHLKIPTSSREQILDITAQVQQAVEQSGVEEGMAWIYCPHTTGAITIQENADPDVRHDILMHLAKLVPHRAGFRHAEGNADSHIKSAMMGSSQAVIVSEGRLMLGTWQSIFFCEFDGPRQRKVWLKVLRG